MPGDKSISHRAVICASLAPGTSEVRGILMSDDVKATIDAFKLFNVEFKDSKSNCLKISGKGLKRRSNQELTINLGNSGTAIRLLAGVFAGAQQKVTLTGDPSLEKRPMDRVAIPLRLMGADITLRNNQYCPVTISGDSQLSGISYTLPVASAQVKSSIMFASLFSRGKTIITEPVRTRDHTENIFKLFGLVIKVENNQIILPGAQELKPTIVDVPGDISSASFFIVGALICNQGVLEIKNVGLNETRIGIIKILVEMGGQIEIKNLQNNNGELVGDLEVKKSVLRGIDVDPQLIPYAIDEFPIISIAAACANGDTRITGAEELRYKESDRIATVASGLRNLGIKVVEYEDGLTISGGEMGGGTVDAENDHRIAMSFTIAGIVASNKIKILNASEITTSFPNFLELAQKVGVDVVKE